MHKTFICFFLAICGAFAVRAQSYMIPSLPSFGNSIKDFLPGDWLIIAQVEGDITDDGKNEIAAIFEYKFFVETHDSAGESMKVKPRILGVITPVKGDFKYRLWVQNNRFIFPATNNAPNQFKKLSISGDTLSFEFAGGLLRKWDISYHFINFKKELRLAKVDYHVDYTIEGKNTCWDLNFISKRANKCSSDEPTRKLKFRITLQEMNHPFTIPIYPDLVI